MSYMRDKNGRRLDSIAVLSDVEQRASYVPKWQPNTAYAAGEPVLSPSGQLVTAKTSFTSGATYSASNWNVVVGASKVTDGTAAGQVPVWDGDSWEPNTPTAVTKTDVGLGNVDNTSDANKPVSTAQQAALDAARLASIVTIPANTTLLLSHGGKVLHFTSASAVVCNIPANATVAFPVGTEVRVFQQGAGQVTIGADSGVTVRSRGNALKAAGQYAEILLRKIATDEWSVVGDVIV